MSTETAVQVVWWIGILLALGLTVVALKLLSELLRTLGHLRELAERTATAAEGLAEAMSGPLRFADAADAAEAVRSSVATVRASAGQVRSAVGEHGPQRREEREPEAGGGMGAGELGGAAGGPGRGPGSTPGGES